MSVGQQPRGLQTGRVADYGVRRGLGGLVEQADGVVRALLVETNLRLLHQRQGLVGGRTGGRHFGELVFRTGGVALARGVEAGLIGDGGLAFLRCLVTCPAPDAERYDQYGAERGGRERPALAQH